MLQTHNFTQLSVFNNQNGSQENGEQRNPDEFLYKTNPKQSTSADGVYRSKVRIVLNPKAPENSVVRSSQYWLKSANRSLGVVSSLSINDRSCPIFTAFKKLWYSNDENKKALAKRIFQKNESLWCIVQVLEDDNQPEMVGKFKIMKLAQDIYVKLSDKMNPSPESKRVPYPALDALIGLELNLEVQPGPNDPKDPTRVNREISYSLSQFGDATPVQGVFSEEELELIYEYAEAYDAALNGKTDKKKKEGEEKANSIFPQLAPLYKKAEEYIKENVTFDLQEEKGYKPWSGYTKDFVEQWLAVVNNGGDPEITELALGGNHPITQPFNQTINEHSIKEGPGGSTNISVVPGGNQPDTDDDDLPF
nr:MAG TPA: hypothetical protein [Caudoviricetes sp.]